jgi:hypothetical protein
MRYLILLALLAGCSEPRSAYDMEMDLVQKKVEQYNDRQVISCSSGTPETSVIVEPTSKGYYPSYRPGSPAKGVRISCEGTGALEVCKALCEKVVTK